MEDKSFFQDLLERFGPPQWVTDSAPEGIKSFLENGGWLGVLAFGSIVFLLLIFALGSRFLSLFNRPEKPPPEGYLEEHVAEFPPLPPSTGDRRLLVEGVPVRLRLVVLAPAGKESKVDASRINQILERVLPGLGDIAAHDGPHVRIWPVQLSCEGFANTFHRNLPLPEGEHKQSAWVMVAGRAQLDEQQVMLGLALQALKPTTVGRKTLKAHEWASVLRVRVRD